jgi:hypothetical protein
MTPPAHFTELNLRTLMKQRELGNLEVSEETLQACSSKAILSCFDV